MQNSVCVSNKTIDVINMTSYFDLTGLIWNPKCIAF
jgi:hypothetical protein